jgi:hypothetical protein
MCVVLSDPSSLAKANWLQAMPEKHNAETHSAQRKHREEGWECALRLNTPPGRGEFCTTVHRFAQRFEQNLIDGGNGKNYFAFQIGPGSLRTLRINLEGAANLTVVAPRD